MPGRGHKTCPRCLCDTLGPRTKQCPKCLHKFTFKPSVFRKPPGEEINWKELRPNDVIKVIQGSGPYWISDRELDEEGNPLRIAMGYSGKYRVKYIDNEGIHAYPVKAKESGHCFLWMGKVKKGRAGTHMCPHKIRKMKVRLRGEATPVSPTEPLPIEPKPIKPKKPAKPTKRKKPKKKKKGPRRVKKGDTRG